MKFMLAPHNCFLDSGKEGRYSLPHFTDVEAEGQRSDLSRDAASI